MSLLLTNETLAPTVFEPKVDYRFLAKITDDNDNLLVPSYIVCGIDRPQFTFNKFGFKKYDILKVIMYDPIVPSTMQAVNSAADSKKKWNINICILGPVGDKVEEWGISNAKLVYVKPSSMDWRKTGDPAMVNIGFKISEVVQYY